MKLWQAHYNMIWLILVVLLVSVLEVIPYHGQIHAVLGLAVVALAFRNKVAIAKTEAPARLKRIAAAMAAISIMAAITGILLAIPPLQFLDTLWRVLHVLTIVAITTQAGSVAPAYDMWEEKEFSPPAT